MKHSQLNEPPSEEMIGNVDNVRLAQSPNQDGAFIIEINGWLLHASHPVTDRYFEIAPHIRVDYQKILRPDLDPLFAPEIEAKDAGYSLVATVPKGLLQNELHIKASATLLNNALVQTVIKIPISIPKEITTTQRMVTLDIEKLALNSFLSSNGRLSFHSKKKHRISVIIVSYNNASALFSCLQSLLLQGYQELQLIIVDNASSDETAELLSKIDGATIIKNTQNDHFVLGVNQGAHEARGELLLLLNQDTQLLPGALDATLSSFIEFPALGALGARLVHRDGKLQEVGSLLYPDGSAKGIGVGESPSALNYLRPRSVDFCSGAFLATPLKLWRTLSGFDTDFAPAYYEDADYCLRARANGYQVITNPRIGVIHNEGATHENKAAAEQLQLVNRNKILSKHEVFFKSVTSRDSQEYVGEPPLVASRERVLLIEDLFPLSSNGQGSPRAKLILDWLLHQDYKVTYVALTERGVEKISQEYPDIEVVNPIRGAQFTEFLCSRAGTFGTIIISRPHNFEDFMKIQKEISVCAQNCKIIYDCEALFALREIRKQLYVRPHSLGDDEIEKIVSTEILSLRGSNQIWVTSKEEQFEFTKRGFEDVSVLSYCAPITPSSHFSSRKGLLFLGPLLSKDTPNTHGFVWFLRNVVPRLNQLGIPVHHAGMVKDDLIPSDSTVVFDGLQNDLAAYCSKFRVLVAPIYFGSGIPLKVIDSVSFGLPVIGTSYICQRLEWEHDREMLVADTSVDFLMQISRIYDDGELWEKILHCAQSKLSVSFSTEDFNRTLMHSLHEKSVIKS